MKSIYVLSALMLLGTPALAAEADYFTKRGEAPEVSIMLDGEMNDELFSAAEKVKDCSAEALQSEILSSMAGFGHSKIEGWFDSEKKSAETKVRFKNSIYQGTEEESKFGALACCAPLAKYKGYVISADKLGHFLHSGFEMYAVAKDRPFKDEKQNDKPIAVGANFFSSKPMIEAQTKDWPVKSRGQGVKAVFEASAFQEEGMWGKEGTGVYSYGDVAANYEGYRFWSELTAGKNPYFVCEKNRWKQARKFSWGDYITDAWDEGINCSEYAGSNMTMKVMGNIGEVLRKNGEATISCPLDPRKCRGLVKRYSGELAEVISPICREAGGEEPKAAKSESQNKSKNGPQASPGVGTR